jgi:hypothetical protein
MLRICYHELDRTVIVLCTCPRGVFNGLRVGISENRDSLLHCHLMQPIAKPCRPDSNLPYHPEKSAEPFLVSELNLRGLIIAIHEYKGKHSRLKQLRY